MIELVTTDGLFALDGGEWEVTNNIWLIGDDREVVVVDAAHDHRPIAEGVAGRRVAAIVLTHGHNDHINAAVALQEAVDAPILLHPDDRMPWSDVYPTRDFPMLIDLYLQGTLNLDGFVSETIGIESVEEAFHKMERGEVLRSVVVL